MQSDAPASPLPDFDVSGEGSNLRLAGSLGIHTLTKARHALDDRLQQASGAKTAYTLDLSGLDNLDTPGALLLCELRDKGAEPTGVRVEHEALLELVSGLDLQPVPKAAVVARWRQLVTQLGKGANAAWHDSLAVITFVGLAAHATTRGLFHPRSLRPAAISRHISETGISALPIIGLMAVMISIVIGYQGIAQLRPYGGEDFTINLVAVSVLREMGVLLTAIMVAGRSGSAFTAEIGVMEAREEVDALTVMGIEPIDVLVVPRVIALVLALPMLTFFSDIMGLAGGALVAQSLLDISPVQCLQRIHAAVGIGDLIVGLIKAPIFAFFIAVISCMHGLRVRGSSESVGRETTRAVVKSIFLVIVLDAMFSILFERIGI